MIVLILAALQAETQSFKYTYNGVTISYVVLSVPNHEVGVNYVPKNVVNVKVPAVVYFNGEAFKVTSILEGGDRKDLIDYLFHVDYEYDNYAFSGCKLLKSVELPSTIKSINSYAFMGCSWLRSINLPSGLRVIGGRAFSLCESLKSITIPSSIKEIGEYAFIGCSSLSSVIIPKQVGHTWKDTIILNTDVSNISISENAFYSKREIIKYNEFRNQVVSSPKYYLKNTYSKSIAFMVKKILVEVGMYEEVLTFYPNDVEVQNLHREAEVNRLVHQGDENMDNGNYTEAKRNYEQALQLIPNDNLVENKIRITYNAIAERERLRKEAEEKARREAEEAERKARREKEKRQVELIVDDNMQVANWYLQNNQLQLAEKYLQKAIDTTYQYDYDYCREKMSKQLNRIRELRKPLADTSCVLSYLTYQPVQYESTNTTLELIIKKHLLSRDKKVERNHISFTLYSGEQPGSFQIEKSSRMLKNMCKEILNNVELQPLEIDDKQWNATATFDYNIEYISSIVNLVQIDGRPSVFNKNTMSSQLESSMEKMFFDKFERLDFSYDGKYKYKVTSMDINGQIRHYAELISFHCKNGPQNAWRSLLVPGWGDKYVSETGKFDIWKTVVSYGATLLGVGLYTGFVPFNNNEVQSDLYYPYYNTVEYEDVFGSSSKRVGVVLAVTGLAVWTYDVLYVWIKGAKNKKEKKQIINSITFSYDVKQNVPTVGYSFNL